MPAKPRVWRRPDPCILPWQDNPGGHGRCSRTPVALVPKPGLRAFAGGGWLTGIHPRLHAAGRKGRRQMNNPIDEAYDRWKVADVAARALERAVTEAWQRH